MENSDKERMSAFKRKNYHSYNDYYFDKKKNHNYSHHLENHTKYKNDKKLENDSFLIHKDYTNSHNFTKEPIDIQFDNNRYFDYHTRNNGTNMDYQRNQDSTLNEKLDRSNTSIDRSFYEQKSDPYNSHRNYGYSTKNHDYHIDTNDRRYITKVLITFHYIILFCFKNRLQTPFFLKKNKRKIRSRCIGTVIY